jgi:proline dehydrogenase
MSLLDHLIVKTLPFVPKPIVGRFSRRYIAGPRLEDAMRVVRELNAQGAMATIDVLGEEIQSREQAVAYASQYISVLDEIARLNLDSNISVKPTALGLKIDPDLCHEQMVRVVARARELGSFVRLDMEDSSCTSDTIEMHNRLKRDFPNLGLAIQAYLRRSWADVKSLAAAGANFRLCKGIYVETRRIAFKDPGIIRKNYTRLLEEMLARGCYVGIATHDESLVWEGLRLTETHGLSRDRFEFQMLLGVEEDLRRILIDAGYRLRVYVPYGQEWYAYSVRRLKENPALAGQVFRSFVRGLVPG